MIDVEPTIRTQLERLAPLPVDSLADWGDVVARSRPRRHARSRLSPKRLAITAVAVAVVGAIRIASYPRSPVAKVLAKSFGSARHLHEAKSPVSGAFLSSGGRI
jgi:hypothetical protein